MAINKKLPLINKNQSKRKKIIGEGARRIVYDLGNGCVLKVAKSKHGINSNKREVIMYKSSPASIKKRLGQIMGHGKKYNWVKMKKYTWKFPNQEWYKRDLYKLRNIFRNNGINPYEILRNNGKPNYSNLRLNKNGMVIVIDYGNFRFHRINRLNRERL